MRSLLRPFGRFSTKGVAYYEYSPSVVLMVCAYLSMNTGREKVHKLLTAEARRESVEKLWHQQRVHLKYMEADSLDIDTLAILLNRCVRETER